MLLNCCPVGLLLQLLVQIASYWQKRVTSKNVCWTRVPKWQYCEQMCNKCRCKLVDENVTWNKGYRLITQMSHHKHVNMNKYAEIPLPRCKADVFGQMCWITFTLLITEAPFPWKQTRTATVTMNSILVRCTQVKPTLRSWHDARMNHKQPGGKMFVGFVCFAVIIFEVQLFFFNPQIKG